MSRQLSERQTESCKIIFGDNAKFCSGDEKMHEKRIDIQALAREMRDHFTLNLDPLAAAQAEILVDVKALAGRVTEIENRRRGVKTVKKLSFREMMQAHLNGDAKQAGVSHFVPAEPMTAFFDTPSEKMLKRRQAAAKAVETRRQAEQAEDQKQRQTAVAISAMFDTKIVTAGLKNFNYSDAEARRKAQGQAAAQRVRDRVFRRL